MNTYNYDDKYLILDPVKLLKALELAKIPTSEYIIIPRILYQQNINTCIIGVNNRTVYSISKYDILKFEENPIILWDDSSLHNICFSTNQINPFIKALKDHVNDIGNITLYYHQYDVNRSNISIATLISANNKIQIKNSQGILDWIPMLELSNPNEILFHFRNLLNNWNNSNFIFKKSLDDDKEFREIWDKKAGEGAMIWIPDPKNYPEDMKSYIIYLSKSMFAVSKNDEVIIEIRNEIPNESYDKFLIKFTVIKKKLKNAYSYHEYYMLGLKIINT